MGLYRRSAGPGEGMLRRIFAIAVSSSLIIAWGGPAAVADPPPGCIEVPLPDGTVKIICEDDPEGPGGGGGGNGGGGERICHFRENEVPCNTGAGSWDGTCYVRVAPEQPPKSDPVWEGNDDGVIVQCTPYECAVNGIDCDERTHEWAPSPPDIPQVSPEQLARRAVASMNLTMGGIGSTPPPSGVNGDAMGQLGLPIWLWVANRQPNTVGPIDSSASDGTLWVGARGELVQTEWVISRNGQALATVTCRGSDASGTPYDGRDSELPSPTCGFPASYNVHPGNLTLTATAFWTVTWEGGGQRGTINVTPPSTNTAIRIGETQTILN